MACRGIEEDTYGCYEGVKVGNQAVFALYRDIDNNGKGTICSTIGYQFESNSSSSGAFSSAKYFQKGLPRGLSVLVDSNVPVKHILVSESPIDALSYKKLNKMSEGTMYISTCGSLSEGVKKELANVLSNARDHGQSVTLAFDKDNSGRKMEQEVGEIAHAYKVHCKSSIPVQFKDWNEELVRSLGRQEMLRKLQKELVTSGQEYELRKQKERGPTVMGMEILCD